jgi:hypothetical protein
MRRRQAFTEAEKTEIWDRIEAGQTPASVAAVFWAVPQCHPSLAAGERRGRPKQLCRLRYRDHRREDG